MKYKNKDVRNGKNPFFKTQETPAYWYLPFGEIMSEHFLITDSYPVYVR